MGNPGSIIRKSPIQRRTAVGVIVALVGSVLVLFAGVASADPHHPELTGTATPGVCQGVGGIQVDVTVFSFIQRPDPTSNGRDINDAIQVYASTEARAGTYTPQGATGAVDHDTSFSRSFTVPAGTTSVWVVAEAQVPWGDGAPPRDVIDGAGNLIEADLNPASIIEVIVPDVALPICEASISGECVAFDGIATLELANPGPGTIGTFAWTLDGPAVSESGSESGVTAGTSPRTITVSGLQDGAAYTATATADGVAVAVAGSPLTIDFAAFPSCSTEPSASISGVCVDFDGIATIELSNGGPASVAVFDWTLSGPGVSESGSEADVTAGETRSIDVSGLADGEAYTATATADGVAVAVAGSPLTIDHASFPSCQLSDPSASITGLCAASDGLATLNLSNGGPATVAVFDWSLSGPGVSESGTESDVVAGETRSIGLSGLADGEAYTATASADGVDVPVAGSPLIIDFARFPDCVPDPSASITGVCVAFNGTATIELSNGGPATVGSFDWTLDGPAVSESGSEADVAAGETRTIDVGGLLDGEAYTATASADGAPVVVAGSPLTIDFGSFPTCEPGDPEVTVSITECVVGQDFDSVDITLINNGDAPVTFFIAETTMNPDGTGVGGTSIAEVPGNSSQVVSFGVAEGATLNVVVETADGVLLDVTHTRRCVEPTADIDIEKLTNGEQADLPEEAVPEVAETDVEWTYIVTNTGELDLVDVEVNDDIEGFICTIPFLAIGASDTCTLTGTAVGPGLYANVADTEGCPVDENGDPARRLDDSLVPCPTDEDPSHYVVEPEADIDIEKLTNGEQADLPEEAVGVLEGSEVVWTYIVTNTGELDLVDVSVVDDIEGFICLIPALAIGESATCQLTGTAQDADLGLYANVGDTVGCPVDENGEPARLIDGTLVDCPVDEDPSHYIPEEVAGPPEATITTSCRAAGGLNVTVTNTGDEAATFTLTKNGTTVDTLDLAAGAREIVVVAAEPGEELTLGLSATGFTTSLSVTRDSRPTCQQIAFTGADSGEMARMAGWLLVIGGLMMALVRRKEYVLATA